MTTAILLALKSFWVPIAFLILVALGYAGFELEQSRVESAKAKEVVAEQKLKQAQNTIDTLKAEIENQNEAIGLWIKTAKDLKMQRDHFLELGDKAGATIVTKFSKVYVPVAVPAKCEQAVAAGAVNAAQVGKLYRSQ
jgi:hypothetical protein